MMPILQLGKQRPGNKSEITRVVSDKAWTKTQASNFEAWGIVPRDFNFSSLLFDRRTFLSKEFFCGDLPAIQNR